MWATFGGVDRGDDFTGKPGTAADVEEEGGRGEVEELEGAVRHRGLDVLDAAGGGVFARFDIVVVEIWWAGEGQFELRRGAEEGSV